jgi:hypothetical protein
MQKPTLITAFAGDTISIRVAVYDHAGQPFLLADNGLDSASLTVQGRAQAVTGAIRANVVSFKFTEQIGLPVGKYNFYARVTGKVWPSDRYTIAYGQIIVKELPDIS